MVLGVLTDRDIVVRAAAKGHHLKVARVMDILTPGAVHCREDDDVKVAAGLMAEFHVRRVIVMKPDNRLAGVLSLADLAVHASETAKVVEDILVSSPFVEPEAETSMRGAGVSETGDARSLLRRSQMRSLVCRELSAIETYKLALARVGREPARDELWRIEREHEQALDLLLADLRRRGEPSPTSSGVRGAWSKVVEGAAMIRGSKAAIKALREGERKGLHDYEDALKDDVLDPEVKSLIRAKLLPQTRAHIPALDRVLEIER